MVCAADTIVDRALVLMGELPRDARGEIFTGEWEGMTVRRMLHEAVADVAAGVILAADSPGCEGCSRLSGDVSWWGDGSGRGWILLPDDFLRLVSFRMSDWDCPVLAPLPTLPEVLARQHGPWAGLRGSPCRPVCVVTARSFGNVLEFFSCRDERATMAEGLYIPRPVIGDDGGIQIPATLVRAVEEALADYGRCKMDLIEVK